MTMDTPHARGRGPRRPLNVSVDPALVAEARALGLSPSVVLEEALRARIVAAERQRWQEENAEAIADFNRRVEETGAFGDRFRRF